MKKMHKEAFSSIFGGGAILAVAIIVMVAIIVDVISRYIP